MYQQYEQANAQENRIPEFYNPGANRNEETQTPEPRENRQNAGIAKGKFETFKARDRSAQPNQNIKYDPPQLTKSVHIKNPELYIPENHHEIGSRQEESRAKEMSQDVGMLLC